MPRGRPRQDRPKFDTGTPELRARREFIVGPRRENWPEPNVADGEHALGFLLWRGALAPTYEMSKRMYDAGIMFAGWWLLCNPKTHPGNALRGLMPGGVSDPDIEHARKCLTEASQHISKNPAVLDTVIEVCVYSRIPARSVAYLRTGLCRLMEWREDQRRCDKAATSI